MSPIHAPSQLFIQHLSQRLRAAPSLSASGHLPGQSAPPPGQTATKVPRWAELSTSSIPFTRLPRHPQSQPPQRLCPPWPQLSCCSSDILQLRTRSPYSWFYKTALFTIKATHSPFRELGKQRKIKTIQVLRGSASPGTHLGSPGGDRRLGKEERRHSPASPGPGSSRTARADGTPAGRGSRGRRLWGHEGQGLCWAAAPRAGDAMTRTFVE